MNLIEGVARTTVRGSAAGILACSLMSPYASSGGYTARSVEIGLTLGGGGPTASARGSLSTATDEDAMLVASLARGDARALELIYERHSRGVYSLALRLLSDSPSAEDVVQEVFLRLWRQPAAYQPRRGKLTAWLLGVAHHHAIDLL